MKKNLEESRPDSSAAAGPSEEGDESSSNRFSRPVAVVLVLGLLASFLVCRSFRSLENKAFRNAFNLEVTERIEVLDDEIHQVLDQVRAVKAFYDGSQRVERDEFQQFATALFPEQNPLSAVEWVPRVPGAWRRIYEQSAVENGLKEFEFREPDASGNLVRAAERDEYFPIYFTFPEEKNLPILGLDSAHDPVRKKAMLQARDFDAFIATPPIHSMREDGIAVVVFAPVYEKGGSGEMWRRRHLMGFVAGLLQADQLLAAASHLFESSGIDLVIEDVTDLGQRHLLYQTPRFSPDRKGPSYEKPVDALTVRYTLDFAGRKWEVICFPTRHYLAGRLVRLSGVLLVTGCIITFLLAGYLQHMLRTGVELKELNIRLRQEIEERVRTEDLRASEERYRGLVEKAADSLLLIDRSGRLVDGNRQACEALGYEKSELLKRSIWDVEPACSRESLDVLWQDLRPGLPLTVDAVFLRQDQSTFPAEIRAGILSLRDEEFLLFLVRDITERRRNEEELRRTNAFLDSIIENIPDMIFIKDAKDLRFMRFNRAGEELLGYRREELLGKNDYDFFPREEADFFTRKDRDVLKEGSTRDIGEEPIHTRSRGLRILHTKKIPIHDAQGEPVYLLGISEDVTDRKHAEERLRELSTAMEHAVEGIARLDAKGCFVTVNPSFDTLLGYAADELNGVSWERIIYEKDQEKARSGYQKMMQWGKAEIEMRGSRKDGSLFYEQAVLIKVHDPESRFLGAYLFIKDITERKYRESLEMKSEMISVVAHELRTPLHAVREGISVMLDGLTGKLNADQEDVLLTAKGSLDRLVRLVNSFLDFQRLEAGIVDFHLSAAALPEVVHEAGKQVESLARGKNLSIEILIGEEVREVFMDRDRIFQVLVNLMNNAIKFTEAGGVTVSIDPQQNGVKISILDTGIGIKAGDLPRLFRKFGQLESGQIVAPGGTGLGLAISRKIIEQHGGKLEVESEFGRGSCFYFTLPYSRAG